MKKLSDQEKVLLNETLIALRVLENNKQNKDFLIAAEKRIQKIKEIGLTDDEIALEYQKFKNELWTISDGENFIQPVSTKTKRRSYEY